MLRRVLGHHLNLLADACELHLSLTQSTLVRQLSMWLTYRTKIGERVGSSCRTGDARPRPRETIRPSRAHSPRHSGGEPPGRDQEAGVPVHTVLGPDRQPLQVPAADQRLPGSGLGETPMVA